jgi:hypothetical protein
MTALSMDRNTEYSLGDLLSVPVAASTRVFAGSLVCVDANGFAVPADDAAGLLLAGVATAQADNRTGSDGDLSVVVRRRGRFRFASGSPLDQSSVGQKAYAVDDQTVALAAGVSNSVAVGVIDKVESSSSGWVSIDAAVLAGR